MTSSAADTDYSDVEPEFGEIAAELYALRPDEFVAARDERVRRARGEGKRALARELGRLRRPTPSAWLVNALWRDRREAVEELLDLGADLMQAQQEGAGGELQDLTARRRRLEATLLDRAGELAEAAGVRASAESFREVQETLAAALSLPDVAAEIRSGRIVRPTSYSGFGTISPPQQQAAPRRAGRRRDEPTAADAEKEQAERRVEEARAAAEVAAADLAERESAAATAEQHAAELRERVEELRQRLRELERDTAAAEREVEAETERRDRAKEADQRARQALERAERRLDGR